jgi:hypothetical protein
MLAVAPIVDCCIALRGVRNGGAVGQLHVASPPRHLASSIRRAKVSPMQTQQRRRSLAARTPEPMAAPRSCDGSRSTCRGARLCAIGATQHQHRPRLRHQQRRPVPRHLHTSSESVTLSRVSAWRRYARTGNPRGRHHSYGLRRCHHAAVSPRARRSMSTTRGQ